MARSRWRWESYQRRWPLSGNEKTPSGELPAHESVVGAASLPPLRTHQTKCSRAHPGLALAVHNASVREATVRAAVEARAAASDSHPGETLVIHELALCQAEARVDVAAVNGLLVGWEIKTERDTLARLPRQQEVYSRVFDRVWLAADERHIETALQLIPDWWGVMRIRGTHDKCRLVTVRPSRMNRSVDTSSVVRLLWRNEVLEELTLLGLADGLLRAPRRVLWARLASAVPKHLSRRQLQARVRTRLKSREGWRVDRQRTSDDDSL